MAKDKSKSGMKNKHLHTRIAFLHKAATYLTDQQDTGKISTQNSTDAVPSNDQTTKPGVQNTQHEFGTASGPTPSQDKTISIQKPSSGGLPLHLSSHLSQVARKSQIRLAPDVKHSICKRCGTIQVEGETCKKFTENLSKGGKKPHADVLIQACGVCGAKKRWPVGARRQRKKAQRSASSATNEVQPEVSHKLDGG